MKLRYAPTAAFLATMMISALAGADVKPAAIFSDHMVLQQGMPAPVWGWADPGEQVTVSIADQKQTATADADGKWTVRLDALSPGNPLEMTIAGRNTVTIKDALAGGVWVGSGQSNMEFRVGPSPRVGAYNGVTNSKDEIAAANYPLIRMYTVKSTTSAEPQKD